MKIDDKTFSAIYEQYMNDVYRFAYSILKNHEDAENAMQDTFLNYIHRRLKILPTSKVGS